MAVFTTPERLLNSIPKDRVNVLIASTGRGKSLEFVADDFSGFVRARTDLRVERTRSAKETEKFFREHKENPYPEVVLVIETSDPDFTADLTKRARTANIRLIVVIDADALAKDYQNWQYALELTERLQD